MERWEAMTNRRSFMPYLPWSSIARGPCASSRLWRLLRPPLVSPPGGRNDLPGWRSSSGDRSGVKGDRQVVPVGTRGAEQSEHHSALDASGGRSYLGGAGERSQRLGLSRSLRSNGSLNVGQIKNER